MSKESIIDKEEKVGKYVGVFVLNFDWKKKYDEIIRQLVAVQK